MNQPIIEVKERKSILSMGIIFTAMFGAIMIMSMLAVEDASMMIYCGFTFGLFVILGLYLILAYKNHSLKVFSGGSMEFSGVLGKKKAFQYRDIAKIEQKYMKTTLSIALKDVNGKCLAKVEGNMMGYEELMQWLYDQQVTAAQTQEEMSKFNTTGAGPAVVSPVKIQGTGKVGRFFLGLFGVILLLFGTIALLVGISETKQEPAEEVALWFDPTTDNDGRQMVEFEMMSYPFASFEYSDAQGLYFVFDSDMSAYIVCMDNSRYENEFLGIYEYTFDESTEMPAAGIVEGYAMPIDDNLKAIAIEEFNILWDDEVLNDDNFEEYLGSFYLDTTYHPGAEEESPVTTIFAGIFILAVGIYMIYYVIKGHKKAIKKVQEQSAFTEKKEEKEPVKNTVDLPIPRNLIVTLLAVAIGAALGGLVWIFFYKLGRIAAISGYLAVVGASWGWSKFGRREMTGRAWAFCIAVGVVMIFGANYISYAWEIVEAINVSSPGRAQFAKVLTNMPSLMTEWDLWGAFVADFGMGILFACVAGFSGRLGKRKQNKL